MLYILIDKNQVCFSLVSAEDNKINFIKKKLFWHLILFIISSASLPFQAITVKHLSLNWSLTRIYNEICCLIGCVSTQNIYVNSCSDIPIYSNTNALAVIHSFFLYVHSRVCYLVQKKTSWNKSFLQTLNVSWDDAFCGAQEREKSAFIANVVLAISVELFKEDFAWEGFA